MKAKRRILAFISLFPFHLMKMMIIYIIFAYVTRRDGPASGKNMRFRLTQKYTSRSVAERVKAPF